jgi:hypothetical protein
MTKDTQLALIDGKALTKGDVFSAIDNVIVNLNRTGDIQEATKVVNILIEIEGVSGKAKAKLWYGMNEWWEQNKKGEDFADHITSTTPTKHRKTVLEYVNVWEQIEQENIPKKVQAKPMRELVPIANMLAQGYEPTKEQWVSIELADNDLGDVINRIKKKKPRKSGLKIYLERDGSLNLWKNNQKKYVGFLDIKESSDPDIAKAIERIVSGAQIIRR